MAIDILPTVAEIIGTDLPKNKIDGKSAWDIWTGKTDQTQHQAFSSTINPMNYMAYDTRIGNSIFPIPIDHSMENMEAKMVTKPNMK